MGIKIMGHLATFIRREQGLYIVGRTRGCDPKDGSSVMWRGVLLAVLLLSIMGAPSVAQARVGEGDRPSFELTTLDGESQSLKELRGTVVLVEFWATWCVPCQRSLPFYAEMEDRYGEQGFKVLAINIDRRQKEVEAFIERHKLSLTILFDNRQRVFRDFSPPTMPTAYLIDRSGEVREIYPGFREAERSKVEEDIRLLIDELNDETN